MKPIDRLNLLDRINQFHDWTETDKGKKSINNAMWFTIGIVVMYLVIKTLYDITHHYTSSL